MIHAQEKAPTFDWLLLLLVLALLGLGLLMINSATASTAQLATAWYEVPVLRQSLNIAVSLLALAAASIINYRFWARYRWALYVLVLLLLAALKVAGSVFFGAQSWFEVWFFALQPSELAKIALIIVLARYFADYETAVKRGTGMLVSLGIALPLLALIYAQPDMGTAVVLLAIWFGMLFVAGVPLRYLLLLALAALVIAPIVWGLMQDYMRDRILSFLHPNTDPSGNDYNVIQALISVGSGGLWGKGLGQGTQSQLAFLRVRHTDYIFSVLAEELGLVGCLLLLALLAGLLLRILHNAGRANDPFARLMASGVAIMLFVQATINIGFNVGLLPVTGLPLPLISYGGSSLIATLIGIGLVQSTALYYRPAEGS